MNEYDPLELELSALRPRGISAETKQCIAESLSASPPPDRRPIRNAAWLRGVLIVGALAASLAAVVLWRGAALPGRTDNSVDDFELSLAAAFDRSLPSAWSYRQALIESPEALDGLLDAQSIRSFQADQSARPFVVSRFAFQTIPSSGEL
jgi:hypothetical protein